MAWAIWLTASALLWFFENGPATLALLCTSLLLPAVSIFSAHRLCVMELKIEAPPEAEKGAEIRAAVSAGRRRFFSRIEGIIVCSNGLCAESAEIPFSMPAGAGVCRRGFDIKAVGCGNLRLSALAHAEDMFGLWRSDTLSCSEEFVRVAPALFAPGVALSGGGSGDAESGRYVRIGNGGDPGESFDIREYVPGDPIRLIQWKLSAKTDKLMVREFGAFVSDQILLVFRNVLASGETVSPAEADAMAEVFLSLSHALLNEGYTHRCAFCSVGRYIVTDIQSDTDLAGFENDMLSLSWETDDGALQRFLSEDSCVHIVLVCASLPEGLQVPAGCERLTILTPGTEEGAAGAEILRFTAEGFTQELFSIEL